MIFQELMQQINLKQELKNSYDLISSIDPNIVGEEYLNVIDAKLRIHLETLNNYELIYETGYSIAKFKALLDDFLPILIQNLRPISFVLSNDFKLGDTVETHITGKATSKNETANNGNQSTSVGNKGLNITNQQGQYAYNTVENSDNSQSNAESNSDTVSTTTSTDRIRYLRYLQQEINLWSKSFLKEIRNNLLRLWY